MNTIKFFRSSKFAFILSLSVFFVSCSEYESTSIVPEAAKNSLMSARTITQFDVDQMNSLATMVITPTSASNNYKAFENWIVRNNGSIKFKGFFNSDNATQVMQNSLQENVHFAEVNGDYSSSEIAAIDKFVNSITDTTSQTLCLSALSDFKKDISNLNLSSEKVSFYNDLFDTFELLSKVDGMSYNANLPVANANRCWQNVVGLALAYGALFTIEVGSFGAGTVVTCAGFVWASATFGGGCR